MNDQIKEKIEALILGALDKDTAESLQKEIDANPEMKEYYITSRAIQAALEMEIAEENRSFLMALPPLKKKSSNNKRFLVQIAAAAAVIVLATVVFTMRFSLTDASISDQFEVSSVAVRSAVSQPDVQYNNAVKAYYSGEYDEAIAALNTIEDGERMINEDKDWLLVLIYLKSEGSYSPNFRAALEKILARPDHEYQKEALKLEAQLNSFWRKFMKR